MQNQHHRGLTSLKRLAIRRTQKPDSNTTGDNEALTIPSPLSPIVEANSTITRGRLPINEEQPIEIEIIEHQGGGPGTC
ncbi:hypothetical protein N7501_008642 [Penicillium viridicatum]|nr:hypothetical protein N7501_008642 [Penicillium viridicatum]